MLRTCAKYVCGSNLSESLVFSQDMLGRALAEIRCLKNRGEADRAVLKAHQSREFYAEEHAAQQDACRVLQPAGVVAKVRLLACSPLESQ